MGIMTRLLKLQSGFITDVAPSNPINPIPTTVLDYKAHFLIGGSHYTKAKVVSISYQAKILSFPPV